MGKERRGLKRLERRCIVESGVKLLVTGSGFRRCAWGWGGVGARMKNGLGDGESPAALSLGLIHQTFHGLLRVTVGGGRRMMCAMGPVYVHVC